MTSHRPSPSFSYTRLIASTREAADRLALEVRSVLSQHGLQAAVFGVELVARECLNNAVLHGNRCDETRKVKFGLACGTKWIRLCVGDEGPGFNHRKRRSSALPGETAESGRGLGILSLYANRVRFNRSGNQITLWLPRPTGGYTNPPSRALPEPSQPIHPSGDVRSPKPL